MKPLPKSADKLITFASGVTTGDCQNSFKYFLKEVDFKIDLQLGVIVKLMILMYKKVV